MPAKIGAFPKDAPELLGADKLDLGDGFLDELARALESGADEEKFNRLTGDALPVAHAVAHALGRTVMRPKNGFEHVEVFAEFGFGEGHEETGKADAWCGCLDKLRSGLRKEVRRR